jgi:hypothetical protein
MIDIGVRYTVPAIGIDYEIMATESYVYLEQLGPDSRDECLNQLTSGQARQLAAMLTEAADAIDYPRRAGRINYCGNAPTWHGLRS